MSLVLASGETFAGYWIEASSAGEGWASCTEARTGPRPPVALKLVAPELAEDEVFGERFLGVAARGCDRPPARPADHAAGEPRDGSTSSRVTWAGATEDAAPPEGMGPAVAVAMVPRWERARRGAPRELVHRDVKPANVSSRRAGSVPERLRGDEAMAAERSLTDTGQLVGTLDYVAPEQIRAEGIDGRPTSTRSAACSTSA